ncbi:replication initiator protein [Sigmofec virus UA08Rod_5336]|uniref:Replication initiator protein n=1 Tax=Sigmofec virus UA08Rod_5336 TaxID=2929419 RepID=A0A976R5B1_9VIRU|nr:replication initiator protein [Sigmofec virus UA08Rod_5336]
MCENPYRGNYIDIYGYAHSKAWGSKFYGKKYTAYTKEIIENYKKLDKKQIKKIDFTNRGLDENYVNNGRKDKIPAYRLDLKGSWKEDIIDYEAKFHHYRKHAEFPCRKCEQCRLAHAQEWMTRNMLEYKQWKEGCFVTLTFDKEHLPEKEKWKQGNLDYSYIQKFMKRLRKHHKGINSWINPITKKEERPIRYFVGGEYGEKNGRCHFHIILHNWIPNDCKKYKFNKSLKYWSFTSKELKKIWGNALFVVVEPLTAETCGYTARYSQKKIGDEVEDERTPEMMHCSTKPTIGYNFLETFILNYTKYLNEGIPLVYQGKVKFMQVPKYFENKLKDLSPNDWYNYMQKKYRKFKHQYKEIKKEYIGMSDWDILITRLSHFKRRIKVLTRNGDWEEGT